MWSISGDKPIEDPFWPYLMLQVVLHCRFWYLHLYSFHTGVDSASVTLKLSSVISGVQTNQTQSASTRVGEPVWFSMWINIIRQRLCAVCFITLSTTIPKIWLIFETEWSDALSETFWKRMLCIVSVRVDRIERRPAQLLYCGQIC